MIIVLLLILIIFILIIFLPQHLINLVIFIFSIPISILGNFGDFLSGIVSAGALFFLYKTLKSQEKSTSEMVDQSKSMQITTKIESINHYIKHNEFGRNELFKINAAKNILKDLTEEIFKTEEYAKYYIPTFTIMQNLPFGNNEYKHGYKSINLILEICPIINLRIDSLDCEIMNHDEELNVGYGIIVLVPIDTLEHKFTLYYTSSFGNHNWCQTFSIYFENTEFEPVLLSKSK